MATGFISRHCSAILLTLAALPAAAADVAIIGIGTTGVVVAIDGGDPKTIRLGQSWKGIKVVAIEKEKDQATLEIDGVQRIVKRGMHHRSAEGMASSGGKQSVKLAADPRGHFIAEGSINGAHMRFLVDTGATAVAIPASDAVRMGLDYRKGRRINMNTANGVSQAYVVTFDRVKIGDIELYGIDGVVAERGLSFALLGMTFLNRVEMRREGEIMTLTRLY